MSRIRPIDFSRPKDGPPMVADSYLRKGNLMGILRTAFWLSAIIILLPAGNDNEPGGGKPPQAAQVSPGQVVVAATSTASDMSEFCERQPGVCKTGSAMMGLFEAKAKNGVSLIYNWATETNVISPAKANGAYMEANLATSGSPDLTRLIANISNEKGVKSDKNYGSKNTLEPKDLIPEWSAPKPKTNS